MYRYKYYNVDTSSGLKIYSKSGSLILASEELIAEYDSTAETFTRDVSESLPTVTVTYTGTRSTVSISFEFGANPLIPIAISVSYGIDVTVDSEIMRLTFDPELTEIYLKNRRKLTSITGTEYWLDKEGCKFGAADTCAMVYHTPNIASMFVNKTNKTLDVVLDSHDSHWYMRTHAGDTSAEQYSDLSDSVRATGESVSYSFGLIVGYDPPIKPRMMLNPDGYVAALIWTEHTDNSIIETQRASMFGRSDITSADNAVGGFAYHDIPITKSVFYYGNDRQVGIKTSKSGSINTDFENFLDGLYEDGYEICLHTPSPDTDTRSECLEAIQYVKENFDTITWIDHGAIVNREAISSDGLIEESEYYIADYWDTYGTKYFWQYGSENGPHTGLDKLAPGEPTNAVTPLYWRHPTRMRDYISWCARTVGSRAYETFLTEGNINALVTNWGFSILHTYSVSANPDATFCTKNQDNSYSISDFAEARLTQMAGLRDNGLLRLATLRDVIEYWLDLEQVGLQYERNGDVTITNGTGHTVNGFSLVLDSENFTLDIPHNVKSTQYGAVVWFDLPTSGTTLRAIKEEDGQQFFYHGEKCKLYSGGKRVKVV